MTKQLLLLGSIITLMAGCSLFQPKTSTPEQNEAIPDDTTSQEAPSDNNSISGNFAALLGLGRNMMCTFENTDDAGNITSGTVYIANSTESDERFRGEFSSTSEGETSQSNVIHREQTNYIWSDAMPQGYISKDIEVENPAEEDTADTAATKQFDFNQDFDYNCQNWTVDESVFAIPSDVEFVDINAQMEQLQDNIKDASGVSCSACDNLSGDAQVQCKQVLGC